MENEKKAYLYELKGALMTETEKHYAKAIKSILPESYFLQPQVNLASIIDRTDVHRWQNELDRIVDFGVFDENYKPITLVEINDAGHKTRNKTKERDEKVKAICEEVGIPLITFWTSEGINVDRINERIATGIEEAKNPIRIAHSQDKKMETENSVKNEVFEEKKESYYVAATENDISDKASKGKKEGCYIATAVYGAYDCPQVMVLRQFRDKLLATTFLGRKFITFYYFVSPWLVTSFSHKQGFNRFFRTKLDRLVEKLRSKGFSG